MFFVEKRKNKMSDYKKVVKEFNDWFLQTFPEHCKPRSLKTDFEKGPKNQFSVTSDLSGVTTVSDGDDAFSLNSCDSIVLKRKRTLGIYRARFSVSDLEYAMEMSEEDRKELFNNFLTSMLVYKCNQTTVEASFYNSFSTSETTPIVTHSQDPRYVELRYTFKY